MGDFENVKAQLTQLIADLGGGPSAGFLYYSGHGLAARPNKNSNDPDHKDEAFVLANNQYMKDDDLNTFFANRIPLQSEVIAMFDCCHSGTLIDCPWKLEGSEGWVDQRDAHPTAFAKNCFSTEHTLDD